MFWFLNLSLWFILNCFVCMTWGKGPKFILLSVAIKRSCQLFKGCSLPVKWSWRPCWKLVEHRCLGLFLNSQFYSVDLYVYSYSSTRLLIRPPNFNYICYISVNLTKCKVLMDLWSVTKYTVLVSLTCLNMSFKFRSQLKNYNLNPENQILESYENKGSPKLGSCPWIC